MLNPSPIDKANNLHVLTLTPFYPTDTDDASGCFVAEPLDWLGNQAELGVSHTCALHFPLAY